MIFRKILQNFISRRVCALVLKSLVPRRHCSKGSVKASVRRSPSGVRGGLVCERRRIMTYACGVVNPTVSVYCVQVCQIRLYSAYTDSKRLCQPVQASSNMLVYSRILDLRLCSRFSGLCSMFLKFYLRDSGNPALLSTAAFSDAQRRRKAIHTGRYVPYKFQYYRK